MASLLTVGTTAATSEDFTLTGETSSLLLTATTVLLAGSKVQIEAKAASGVYIPIGALDTSTPMLVLSAPGTYRVNRPAGPSCGVDRS